MLELVGNNTSKVIKMGDMKPLQVGVIVTGVNSGDLVMRTQSECHIEVMNLTRSTPGACWSYLDRNSGIDIRLLEKGIIKTINVYN